MQLQPSRYSTQLAYDPHETYEAFCARKQQALDVGRQAVRARSITGDLYLFYEYLVERVGGNRYTWVSEETMAEVFGVDASTIKRWIAKLVRAGLIRRQRQFARSSRTYIVSYDPASLMLDGQADAPPADSKRETDQAHEQPAPAQEDGRKPAPARSFWRRDAPTFGADLRRDPIKESHLNLLGGGANDRSEESRNLMNPEIIRLIEREGAHVLETAPKLLQRPLEELQAVSAYLDTQRNIEDRPRLFAWLVLRDFGRKLLSGEQDTQRTRCTPTQQRRPQPKPQADDPSRYISGPCRDLIRGWREEEQDEPPTASPSDREPGCAPNEQIWQEVLDRLQATLPAEARVWFAETEVLELTAERAVIGTPTCIERDQLRAAYEEAIRQALHLITGQPLQVQIEIGRSGAVSAPVIATPGAETPPATTTAESAPLADLWQRVLDALRQAVTETEFQTWFAEARLLDLDNGQAIVGTPNIFAREKLEGRYAHLLHEALCTSLGQLVAVQVVIGGP